MCDSVCLCFFCVDRCLCVSGCVCLSVCMCVCLTCVYVCLYVYIVCSSDFEYLKVYNNYIEWYTELKFSGKREEYHIAQLNVVGNIDEKFTVKEWWGNIR